MSVETDWTADFKDRSEKSLQKKGDNLYWDRMMLNVKEQKI